MMRYRTHTFAEKGFTAIAAHRGGAKLWPENSHEALLGSIALGVDAVEFDVHLSLDDEVMVFHDPTLDRTTSEEGPLRALTAAALQDVPLHNSQSGIPLFSNWAALLAAENVALSLELKCDVANRRYSNMEAKCLAIMDKTQTLDDALVHSFSFSVLRRFRKLHSNVFLAANVDGRSEKEAGSFLALLDEVHALDAGNLNAAFTMMTPKKLAVAHQAGLSVTLWTIDDDEDLELWLKAGVDAIATDRPARALELRKAIQNH
ncbi:MAG: hypothetical protein GY822_01205 [Deltaproteobacteria bacterium]|nr:hypothetical protein [Deltaproteobacteria bacterium]